MVEAVQPAPEPKSTYAPFSEQTDKKTGLPVGLVPLEVLFQQNKLKLDQVFRWHDVGVGLWASTRYFLDRFPYKNLQALEVVTSEPFPETVDTRPRNIAANIARYTFIEARANEAVGAVRNCDLITFINMIHLVGADERRKLFRETIDSLVEEKHAVLSTSFIDNWSPNARVQDLINNWQWASVREAARQGADIKAMKQEMVKLAEERWSSEQYIEEVKQAGFYIEHASIEEMPCTLDSYRRIIEEGSWRSGMLPTVDDKVAYEISKSTLLALVERRGLNFDHPMPRNTLVLVVRKPET